MKKITTNDAGSTAPKVRLSLDELAREGARRMILAALELEVEEYVSKLHHLRDEKGHAVVVRNGSGQERTVQLGAGAVKIKAPRVDDGRPDERFGSQILPPYMRRSPRLEEALPVLLGPEAAGLSASAVSLLLTIWQDEYRAWRKRSLLDKDDVYLWADGVYFQVRLEEDRVACLVVIGVLADGSKEVIALEDG